MKARPILMSTPMVHALLEGRKTQTRRIIKSPHYPEEWIANNCPYGRIGDLLWVRETFCLVDDQKYGGIKWLDYRATPECNESHPAGWENAPDDPTALKWKPSIYMPRIASRLTLEITGVRVQSLNDISEEDAQAEGVSNRDTDGAWTSAVEGYAGLWDSINGKWPWDGNPAVWCISFLVINKNVDEVIKSYGRKYNEIKQARTADYRTIVHKQNIDALLEAKDV